MEAIKAVTTTIPAALKKDRLLDWGHMLVLNAIQTKLEHQIDAIRARKKTKLANKLDEDEKDLICTLVKDRLLTAQKTMHAKDHHFTSMLNSYTQRRDQMTAQPENNQKSIPQGWPK